MPCPVCGEICRCSSEAKSTERSADLEVVRTGEGTAGETRDLSPSGASDGTEWRQEIAARLNRYQSRRKPRPPRYPSLSLRFEPGEENASGSPNAASSGSPAEVTQTPAPVVRNALALRHFPEKANSFPATANEERSGIAMNSAEAPLMPSATAARSPKIIEFPHPWFPPPRPPDELAEPVLASPRILDVPEVVPPPPALGGITIEPLIPVAIERRPGIDFPLQSASLGRRIFAAVVDAFILAASGLVFGSIFWKLTAMRPPRSQMAEMVAGFGALFWAVYQYLLIVYSGSTPGLRLARLQLSRFDGTRTSRQLRRWRVLASLLSALSLGMGYAWVFLDEDALCWHDRITHTYLAPRAIPGETVANEES